MGLPKIDLPMFETKLVSTGRKKIKYRPFTVKEEKILLIAQESNDIEQVIIAMKQIIGNCCSDIDPEQLPMFDVEYLLMQIRGKSVNNVIEFKITDPETEKQVDISLDVDEIKIVKPKGHNNQIEIKENTYVVMRYPTINQVTDLLNPDQDETTNTLDIMIHCIDSVVDGDVVYDLDDFTKEEVVEFVDSFPTKAVEEIKNFFETMPVMRVEKKYTNANGDEKKIVLEGTETFFI
jgi:hypothetical protein